MDGVLDQKTAEEGMTRDPAHNESTSVSLGKEESEHIPDPIWLGQGSQIYHL